jgi:hypothetical protein
MIPRSSSMRTYPDKYEDFLLTDDEYISRISRKLADAARWRSRHRNREAGDDLDDFDEIDSDFDEDPELENFDDPNWEKI